MTDLLRHLMSDSQFNQTDDYMFRLKEAVQHITLLGLWRANFFDHAAFYGGTCLRILYGLNRFSEDLDFSLLQPQIQFNLEPYFVAIEKEVEAFGLTMKVEHKKKVHDSPIMSAFIKGNTSVQLMTIAVPDNITKRIHKNQLVKIKFELDTEPPQVFDTEIRRFYSPIPYFVRAYKQPDLFAGKMHALLCRAWQSRIKGRDWFDFVWYVSKNIPLHTAHLRQRLINSGHLELSNSFDHKNVIELLMDKIATLDINLAKDDVLPFVNDYSILACWSREFFEELARRITFI
ncbi:MAG: nucleotidyl transferase AbiEii/AbiGii toxin family protein [Gammaproteobacteria bacterium]|nr:nucleotidyl transferase AbiEii/AbiGii toxin family protein [Gammaproteobacteria bacterium]